MKMMLLYAYSLSAYPKDLQTDDRKMLIEYVN